MTQDEIAFEKLASYHGCITGDCPHEDAVGCLKAIFIEGLELERLRSHQKINALKNSIAEMKYMDHPDDLIAEADKALGTKTHSPLSGE